MPFETTVIERIETPAELLEPCREPDLAEVETNEDLERVAGIAVAALAACNQDKERIKAWQEENL